MATIGIDATALSTCACGGIGTSQYQTMRALVEMDTSHRFILYAVSPPLVPFSQSPLDLPWPVRLGAGLGARSNILWMQTGVNSLLAEDRVEVFWGPRHLLPFLARGVGKVATIHDFCHRHHPRQQPLLNRGANRMLIAGVAKRADVVVTPSAATARDAARFGHVAPGKVHIVPWGVDPARFRPAPAESTDAVLARLGVRRPYLLSLDVLNPRKNFAAVLEGVARLPAEMRQPLTLVGLGGSGKTASGEVPGGRAVASVLQAQLRLVPDVSSEDLVALYSGALALVYPSLCEGFGMPMLEAMSCGCPVIAADSSALPEVAGDAALLVDPTNAQQVTKAIARLASDKGERARLVAAGNARARRFPWRATAEGMVAAFEQALYMRGRGAA